MSGDNTQELSDQNQLIDYFLNTYKTAAILSSVEDLKISFCNPLAKNNYSFLNTNENNTNLKEIYPSLITDKVVELITKNEFDNTELKSEKFNLAIKKLIFEEKEYLLVTEVEIDNSFYLDNREFRTITENTADVVAKISIDGHFIYITPNCLLILGYNQNEMIGKSIHDFLHPDETEDLEEYQRTELRKNLTSSITLRFRKKDGKYLWIETKTKSLRNTETNKTEFLISILRDITEKKTEEEILNARLRLHKFADNNTLNALLQKTLEEAEKLTDSKIGFYHFVNQDQRTVQLQEWSVNTIEKFCERVYDDHAYDISKAGVWVDCFYTKAPVIHNNYNTLPHKKGMPAGHAAVIRMLTVPVKRKNKVAAILGVGNKESDYTDGDVKIISRLADLTWDIAEKKIAENKLAEQQKKIHGIFSIAPVGIAMAINGIIHEINDTACNMLGYNRNELLMKDSRILHCSDEEYNKIADNIYTNVKLTGSYSVESKLKKNDGSVLEVLLSYIPLDIDNFEKGIIFTAMDITERKDNERKLNNLLNEVLNSNTLIEKNLKEKNELIQLLAASEEKLKRSNSEKDKFFSIISHDLRSPFQGFIGMSQLLAEHFDLLSNQEIKDLSKELLSSASNLYKLLENLLEWSKMQRGSTEIKFTKNNLSHIVMEIVVLLKKNAAAKQQIINHNIPDDFIVCVDTNLITGILRNLLSNAIKFTDIGGEITISAKKSSTTEIQISVKDTGIGFSETELDNLFKLDKKVSKSGTMGELSTGLGLILCREYVTKLNGKIWVESELKKGTTFYFTVKTEL